MRIYRLIVVCCAVASAIAALPAHAQAPACTFGPGALPADTLPPGAPHGAQIPIDHIVVLMQENRSYDHYFGKLRKKSGPPRGSSNPDPLGGDPIRPFHQKHYCEVADLDHSWNGTHNEWNSGEMNGFTFENVDPEDPSGSRTMGFYKARDLPFYYKLYKKFAMSDRFFCSVLSQTFPNRYYLLAGTSFGHVNNAFPDLSGDEWTQRTIFNLLDEAEPPISWRIYYSDLPFAALFGYVRARLGTDALVPISQFAVDAAAGTLPQVAFVDPSFVGEMENDEHPPSNVQLGQALIAGIINAAMASPQWGHLAIFLTYDEHGGYWDHVPPPAACLPDDIAPLISPTDYQAAFDRFGIRVPFVAVSPFSRKRYVSHTPRDHTSILRFIETRFDLPALTSRDANADPLLELFDFDDPPYLRPPRLPAAKIDPKKQAECEALAGS
jgi:phospholipase C